ncbi:sterol desaturase family protein [Roseobacter sp. HKCCD9010]|uniref:sterol desaturase family protein n=1 Tax=unclassified Roseobacter TaxID=196798 RepID=UPI0014921670|nr:MULTISPECIES: sterol desaturase family protein [unclassified Roseobacter]MBF9050063.1 sterol desaturase family protein [Rhodobacterales bacterium HKCCD4356]NNV12306.1 sterol desaturase family protein [Roseobacter sp. HKCCD7357]NNV16231.1 sterol desaturase family protein [Roseobacter sp. HKCCD8768]NNV25691.1 sterol desaturase family protein [Roseobacter sp. HKCCD8192]NNV29947.1 sterol desaturase family protein [Roseobacter sp. HKCCD9061]
MTDLISYPDVVQWAVPLFLAAILAELLWITIKHRGGRYETRDALTSLIMGAGSVASGIILGFIAWGFFMTLWAITPLDLGTSIWVVALCFVLDDLRYYWVHRFGHRIRWVWASHVNHHSSQHYNLTTALRQTWTGTFTFMMVVRAPLILLGFHPAMVLFVGGLNLIYQFWIHTEAIGKMPRWFEAVMNTPSHHRVHHGRNPRYLDANYAGVFIVWDKLFGTFVPELEEEKPDYGLVHNIGTFNPLRVAFHEWVGMLKDIARPGLTFSQRVMYAVAPPGWSHDGSRQTSEQIKASHLSRHPEDQGTPGFEQDTRTTEPAE